MPIQTDNIKQKMIHTDTIGARLRRERERIGMSQAAFADLVGTSKPSQVRYESGERSPDGNYFSRLAQCGVDILFVLTGRHHPALSDPPMPMPGAARIEAQEYSAMPVYDVDAAAGPGVVPLSEAVTERLAFPRAWFLRHGLVADLAGIMPVRGDSMSPTIPDGARVIVDFRARGEARPTGVCILRHDGDIRIKRIFWPSDGQPGRWALLVSDNRAYPPELVERPERPSFDPLARVRAVLSLL